MTKISKDTFINAKTASNEASLYSQFDTRSLEKVIFKGEGYLCFDDSKAPKEYRYLCYRTSIAVAERIFAAHKADEISYKATGRLTGLF